MSRLEEIKNEYAKELELSNWDDMIEYFLAGDVNGIFYAYENVINRYAKECSQASLNKAYQESLLNPDMYSNCFCTIDEESITKESNIVIL